MAILNQGGKFLKAENVKDGDLVTFTDEGVWVDTKWTYPDGNTKQQFQIGIDYKGDKYVIGLGKFSREELLPAYGNDTSTWVGKNAKIKIENYRSLNKIGIILFPTEVQKKEDPEEGWDDNK